MRRLIVPLAVLAALMGVGCSVTYGSDTSGASAGTRDVNVPLPSSGGRDQIVAVVQRVLPAVVNVTTDQYQPGAGDGQGVGTGFVVRSDGVIVTNCHVVEQASKITVFSSDDKPKEYAGRVIGGDCEHDLAIVKIDATGLPTVALGDSDDLQLGQRVGGARLRPRARRRPHRHDRHRLVARPDDPRDRPQLRRACAGTTRRGCTPASSRRTRPSTR
jgi:putative serine protease PepD